MTESIFELIKKLNSFISGDKLYTHKLTFTVKKGIIIFHMLLT